MKIALDYDKTYTLDPVFWEEVSLLAEKYRHEIRIVTYRDPIVDNVDDKTNIVDVIYTDGIAKKFYCQWFADNKKGWMPDVWIDDRPEVIMNNSTATPEILEKWRESDEYKCS